MSRLHLRILRICNSEITLSKVLDGVDLNKTIDSFYPFIFENDEKIEDLDISMNNCGKELCKEKSLADNGITEDSLIYLIVKSVVVPQKVCNNVNDGKTEALGAINLLIRSGKVKQLLDLINDRNWIQKLIANDPEIGHDIIALSILHDIKMLTALLKDKRQFMKFLAEHPCMVRAIRFAVSFVLNQSTLGRSGAGALATNSYDSVALTALEEHPLLQDYTVDQEMDDDDDDADEQEGFDEDDVDDQESGQGGAGESVLTAGRSSTSGQRLPFGGSGSGQLRRSGAGTRRLVTTASSASSVSSSSGQRRRRVSHSELQAAIAQAQGMLSGISTNAGTNHATAHRSISRRQPQSTTSPPIISSSSLSQALAAAVAVASPPASQLSTATAPLAAAAPPALLATSIQSPEERWQTQLRQLQDMGVADMVTAIQALEATNGDISLALNILFN